MKASVQDKQILAAMRPLELAAYLRSTGWNEASLEEDRWAVWTKEGDFEIALPLNRAFGDFVQRMGDALRTLEAVEERSQLEILNDLLTSSTDVLRLRISDTRAVDGTIPIEEGAQIVQQARDLVMAGACAAIEKKAVYQSRKPNQALDYLKKVRMGQTERGSFVVTVLSPVAPVLHPDESSTLFDVQDPYERQVTKTLSQAVLAAKRAANSAAATGKFHDFEGSVSKGVSANLCDAVCGLARGGEVERDMEISFSWSRSRPLLGERVDKVEFTKDTIPLLEEAARIFKDTTPREEFELNGPVVKLERQEGLKEGRVTVLGFVEGQPRKVILELNECDYHKAVIAHDEQQTIECRGLLVKEGRGYILQDPRDIQVEPVE